MVINHIRRGTSTRGNLNQIFFLLKEIKNFLSITYLQLLSTTKYIFRIRDSEMKTNSRVCFQSYLNTY